MQLKKRWVTVLSVVLVFSLMLMGCGNTNNNSQQGTGQESNGNASGNGKKTLKVHDWNGEDINAVIFDDIVNEFNARSDVNGKIEVERTANSTYYTKLNAQVAANNTPDLFVAHAAGKMKTYKDGGKLFSLSEALEADQEWKNRFNSGVFNLMTFDDEVYGIPTSLSATALFYNKEIFEKYNLEIPTTYEELLAVMDVLNKNGIVPFAFGAKDAWASALFSEIVANRIGGNEPFDALMDGGGTWEDPSFIKAGYVMQELAEKNAFPKGYLGLDYGGMLSQFKSGKAAMFVMGSWAIGSLLEEDSLVKDKVGVAKFPTFQDGKGNINTWLGQPDFNFVISSDAEDKEAAIEFLKTWSTPEVQKRLVEEAGKIPVAKTDVDPNKVSPLATALNEAMSDMEGMFIFYDVGLGEKIGNEYNNTIQSILAGKEPEAAFKDLQSYTEKNR